MIVAPEKTRHRHAAVALAVLALGCGAACTASRIQRAIDARGGPLESYRKDVTASVKAGMPGNWRWEVDYRVPDSFAWSLWATGEDQTLLFDGAVARYRLGGATLPPAPADRAVQSQARWFALTSLDVLRDEATASWQELPGPSLPPGVSWGVVARLTGVPEPLELMFDERDLLVRARGKTWLEPIGAGMLDATFSDYRPVDGYLLPFSGEYSLDGRPLMHESVQRWQPNDSRLDAEYFSGQ